MEYGSKYLDGGGPGRAVDECELSEAAARLDVEHPLTVHEHVHLAAVDHVEVVAVVS